MVYLAACAVNGAVPDEARVRRMDLEALYLAADRHAMTGVTAMALESAGVKQAAFTQAKGKAIRKVAAFDVERAAVLAKLEEAGVWYMPLKGSVLKDLYPRLGMRQMADVDILFDGARTKEARAVMEGLGFSAESTWGRGNHDHYFKPPICHFELHRTLFGAAHDARLVRYYQNVKDRLIRDEGGGCGFHFREEDFYLYMIAHEYKHYSGSGTGLRSALDTYVYLKKRGDGLDWSYIAAELNRLELTDFEAQNRGLALHLFEGGELTAREERMLEELLSSGTYGTIQKRVRNGVGRYGDGALGKTRYLFSRLFPPMNVVRSAFPFFARHPILLPILPGYRIVRELTFRKEKLWAELTALLKL